MVRTELEPEDSPGLREELVPQKPFALKLGMSLFRPGEGSSSSPRLEAVPTGVELSTSTLHE